MLAPLVLALSLAGSSPPVASETLRIEAARVVRVSPRPTFGSGVLAVYADFDVLPPNGPQLHLYLLWMGANQFLPEVGSVCNVTYRHEPLLGGNAHDHSNLRDPGDFDRPHNVVLELSCGPPLELPCSSQRSPSTL